MQRFVTFIGHNRAVLVLGLAVLLSLVMVALQGGTTRGRFGVSPADRDAEGTSKFGSGSVMKRPAQPEEIAPAYVFLASPQCSSYITGEVLPIIGGYGGG